MKNIRHHSSFLQPSIAKTNITVSTEIQNLKIET